ncbi:hypothetical protein FAF44_44560 [Nonomuraea sp. MG754425]|uniref:hypothetical protein n=1 Tax=Nonomuraea sp. MG754425 TaxID=2570319 RepID=UPI001F35810C|nr:hypothetical protein [Nonomuraea sp. MG754425]MCF6475385.1 hypothetical protein [Nonomuraea sp. MG754425]
MLEIILGALAAVVIEVVVRLLQLAYSELIRWFLDHTRVENPDNVAFTLRTALDNNRYTLVQGVFNKRSNEVEQARRISAASVDGRIKREHAVNDLVVYE